MWLAILILCFSTVSIGLSVANTIKLRKISPKKDKEKIDKGGNENV